MFHTRRLHVALALAATLVVTAPGAASARPKLPMSPGVSAGVAFDGGFDGVQCDAIATFINDEITIIRNANPNTKAGKAAIAAAAASVEHALQTGTDGGCFFGGIVWA